MILAIRIKVDLYINKLLLRGQRGLVVKRLPGSQEVGGWNPTTAM